MEVSAGDLPPVPLLCGDFSSSLCHVVQEARQAKLASCGGQQHAASSPAILPPGKGEVFAGESDDPLTFGPLLYPETFEAEREAEDQVLCLVQLKDQSPLVDEGRPKVVEFSEISRKEYLRQVIGTYAGTDGCC